MNFTEKFNAKHFAKKPNDLSKETHQMPKNGVKKADSSKCYSCKHYERGPDLSNIGVIHWCMSRGFDKILRKSYTDYKNIELMGECPKAAGR